MIGNFDIYEENPYGIVADTAQEFLYGDNDRLKILVSCADNDEMNYFQYAVDIMVKLIAEKAPELLNKADDFKFLCLEYD